MNSTTDLSNIQNKPFFRSTRGTSTAETNNEDTEYLRIESNFPSEKEMHK